MPSSLAATSLPLQDYCWCTWPTRSPATIKSPAPAITEANYIFQWLKLHYLKGKAMHSQASCTALIRVCTQFSAAQPLITGSLTIFSITGAEEAHKKSSGERNGSDRGDGEAQKPSVVTRQWGPLHSQWVAHSSIRAKSTAPGRR